MVDTLPNYLPKVLKKADIHKKKCPTLVTAIKKHQEDLIRKYKKLVPKEDLAKFQKGEWLQWLVLAEGQEVTLLLSPEMPKAPSHEGLLEDSLFGYWRSQMGGFYQKAQAGQVEQLIWDCEFLDDESLLGCLVGVELSSYQYLAVHSGEVRHKSNRANTELLVDKKNKNLTSKLIIEGQSWGFGQNLARHLVNLPPGECYPEVVGAYVERYFKGIEGVKVKTLGLAQIKAQKMGLLLGVGQGSQHEPRFVHISYAPKKKANTKHIALVGKGVTFDTGGLDIKPSSGMRLMKKDMGGAAAVIGASWYAAQMQLPVCLDTYIPLAENSVDAKSMRPSDVLKSRSGLLVEIHNTDAEGRLVLADALDYALTQTQEPDMIIDVATLTGAIKSTLGLEISGLFSNHDELADKLLSAAQKSGDLTWRMPLYSRYAQTFSTPFADMVNAVDGWGGPITAALFLEKFVRSKPWAHFDIYAWQDKPSSYQAHAGGSGQGCGMLCAFLKSL